MKPTNQQLPDELDRMRKSCSAAAAVMGVVGKAVRVGASLLDVEAAAVAEMNKLGVRSAFLGIHGFPSMICVSVNEEILHGIPSRRVIVPGDVVKVDLGVVRDGWYSDTAATFLMDDGSPEFSTKRSLSGVALTALMAGISQAKAGNKVLDVTRTIEMVITSGGFHPLEGMTGHGVGRRLHMPPTVPNQVKGWDCSYTFQAGDTIAIEPMVGMRSGKGRIKPDGWTIVMADGCASAHFEHTILITEGEPEVLTQSDPLTYSQWESKGEAPWVRGT